jgi:uncharacterized protein
MAQAAAVAGLKPLPARPEMPEGADPFPRWPAWFAAAGFAIGVGAGVVALVLMLPGLALFSWGFDVDVDDALPVLALIATFFQDVGWVVAAIVLAATIGPVRAWHFGFQRPRLGPAVGWSVVAILAYAAIALIYTVLLDPQSQEPIETGDYYGTLVGTAVLIVVVAPLFEEVFFRGFLYRILRGRLGLWPALVIGGSLFGAVHVTSGGPLAVALIAPLGFLLCLIYERSGSLYPCIALHALNNGLVAAAEFDRVSGIALALCGAMLLGCLLGSIASRRKAEPRVTMAP